MEHRLGIGALPVCAAACGDVPVPEWMCRRAVQMELSDITAYLRRKVEPPKDRMPKMPVKIKRKEKTL